MSQSTAEQPSIDFGVGGMTCGSCAARVQRVLSRQSDVEQAEVNFATGRAHVVLREPGADIEALRPLADGAGHRIRAALDALKG